MRKPTCSGTPGVLATGVEVAESGKLRREVTALLCSAAAEAAADLSSVSRGCRSAAILTRSDAIRARHGMPPNPVASRKPRTDRERQDLAARARQAHRARRQHASRSG